jgi:hypothetical protein
VVPGAPPWRFLFLRRTLALVLAALEVSAPGNTRKGALMSESLERLARNQSLFRAINEKIEELSADYDAVQFMCECSDTECVSTVEMKFDEYERIRSNSAWFFVRTGHDLPEIERVVSQDDGYVVVEKFVATRFAKEADPRSDDSN